MDSETMSSPERQTEDAGTVAFEGDYATITFSRRLGHPPEHVWSALTDPQQLQSWYMTRATIAPGRDGSIDFLSGPAQYHVTGRILSWDPPHLFEHQWKVEPCPGLPSGEESVVRWELVREGRGTLLTLTHRRLTRRTAAGFAPGIHVFLDRMEASLDGAPMPDWRSRVEEMRTHYRPARQPLPPAVDTSGQARQRTEQGGP
jgi:uncharacterized protein YndB with AHSA1/START domain